MSLNLFGFAETERYKTHETKKIEEHINRVIKILHKGIEERHPFFAFELEKHCINFESAFFATNAQEQKRYDKQLSELQSGVAVLVVSSQSHYVRGSVAEVNGDLVAVTLSTGMTVSMPLERVLIPLQK